MKKAVLVAVCMLVAAGSLPPRSEVTAQTFQCLSTGVPVSGDTRGLDVQPCSEPRTMDPLNVADTNLDPVLADPPPGSMSTLYWGYSAAFFSAPLNAYRAIAGNPLVASCVPSGPHIPVTSNGRGVAFDPLDGNLWISRLTIFAGDSRITKVSPPISGPSTCPEITSLLVHYSGGVPPEQDGFGALDTDQGSKHIWAAGYIPVLISGTLRSYFYLVNRNNGLIIQSCWIPARAPLDGNDSLTYARLPGLPGSGQYLITDNGEFFASDTPWLVIDTASCHNGQQVTPVATFVPPRGTTGMDFEWLGMLDTNLVTSFNDGNQPFTGGVALGLTLSLIEDISVCGFRAKFGGDGNDGCPYP